MKTKKITLYYSLSSRKVLPPSSAEIERKDYWIKEVQSTVESDWKPKTIRVTYEVYDPEVDKMRKFLNGPVLEYWIIQSQEILVGDIEPRIRKLGRETLFDKVLGYDVETLSGKSRARKSTKDFTDTQQMHNFLEVLRETEFEPNGYEFPNSNDFWEMANVLRSYEKAKEESIKQLQSRLRAKLEIN